MPSGGLPLVRVNAIFASRRCFTASIARAVSTLSWVTRVPSTSAMTKRIFLTKDLAPYYTPFDVIAFEMDVIYFVVAYYQGLAPVRRHMSLTGVRSLMKGCQEAIVFLVD